MWTVPSPLIVALASLSLGQSVAEGQSSPHYAGDFFLWVLPTASSWGSWGGKSGEHWGSRGEKMGSANKAVMGDAVMELRSFQIFRTKLRRLAIHDPAPMDLLPLDHHHHQMTM